MGGGKKTHKPWWFVRGKCGSSWTKPFLSPQVGEPLAFEPSLAGNLWVKSSGPNAGQTVWDIIPYPNVTSTLGILRCKST